MKYKSTRGGVQGISFKDAVMMGLAEDGGLLVPENLPAADIGYLHSCACKSYESLAFEIFKLFADDIEEETLWEIVKESYTNFDSGEIVPVVHKDGIYVAELFHGPTYAFKDIALQFLGNLFEHILKERSEKMNILGATSGDTGSAAIYGVKGKDNINIFILHPSGKVSPVQELQMTTVKSENVFNIAVKGSFDDCQAIVKNLFSDLEFKSKYNLGAVNSINWARILAQIVYYFYIYFRICDEKSNGGKNLRFVVPTGNFGNILAGFYARRMGLPIDKLVLATNENNILHRMISYGDYSVKDVVQTYSPSMDIQLSSNLERYLYYLYEEDSETLDKKMKELNDEKRIHFTEEEINKISSVFLSQESSNEETLSTIRNFYNSTQYILDPHTACGVKAAENFMAKDNCIYVCLATAHPAKFPDAVYKAIGKYPERPEGICKLNDLEKQSYVLNNNTDEVKYFIKNILEEGDKNAG
ncbi:MAG TPA: threonine synthase [Flexistipes sinusarabici]|uniref:Threonine synthase n=2 Tax=Flexistipes sinusarabici TaxID=2352 RepID=A0A3D5QB58_FLESI|nr:threonine synthase [Flexistipes sinusarabici]